MPRVHPRLHNSGVFLHIYFNWDTFPSLFLPLHTTSCLFCPQQAFLVTSNCRLPFLIQLHTCHVALSVGTLLLPGAWDTRVIYSPSGDKSSETWVSFQMFYIKSALSPFSSTDQPFARHPQQKQLLKPQKAFCCFFFKRQTYVRNRSEEQFPRFSTTVQLYGVWLEPG